MVFYTRIDQVSKSRICWLFLYRAFVSFVFSLLFVGISTLLYIHFYQSPPKYPNFRHAVPDSWLNRTQIYADANYNVGNISHDYRLNQLQTIQQQNLQKTNDNEKFLDNLAKRLVCYFSVSEPQDKFQQLRLADVGGNLCTHINIGLIEVHNYSLVLSDTVKEVLKVDVALLRAKNPALKLLIWVGGGSATDGFPAMVRNHTTRKWFIQSLKHVLAEYRLDGVDLDWEFPSAYNKERQHFSQLLYEIKQEYRRERRNYLLSVAVAAPEGISLFAYDVRELNNYADHVNLMCYDYHFYSGQTPFTGLNAPLFARSNEHSILATLNINYSVNWWLANGLSAEKLIVGLPTYGHTYTLVNPFNSRIGAPASDYGRLGFAGFTSYSEFCWFQNENLVTKHYDEEACSPYLSSATEWISYENEQSIKCKVDYVRSKNLGGVMVFSLNTDDFLRMCADKRETNKQNSVNFPLIKKVKELLHN